MEQVLWAAAALSLSSLAGLGLGLSVRRVSEKANSLITSFACGAMLATALYGLIGEAVSLSDTAGVRLAVLAGAGFMALMEHRQPAFLSHGRKTAFSGGQRQTLLFVFSVILHRFPEGLAAGISFTVGTSFNAWALTAGIALHNLPETMILALMMNQSGLGKRRAAGWLAAGTLLQAAAMVIGWRLVSLSHALVPLGLSFAAGTILFTIVDEMIPETHEKGSKLLNTMVLIAAFVLVLLID
jgi:ZIP family zinc transporter